MCTHKATKPSCLVLFLALALLHATVFKVSADNLQAMPHNQLGQQDKQNHRYLALRRALELAVKNDPWLKGSQFQQDALLANSMAASELPNPVLSLSLANLPTDGFAFDQEPMTQIKAGVSQMFGRGDSLAIKREQLERVAMRQPLLRQDRIAGTQVQVALLWFDLFKFQQSIALIENDRALFEQLFEAVQASYASALNNVRQQDIVHAQLELTRLEDRLTQLRLQQNMTKGQLAQWLVEHEFSARSINFDETFILPEQAPNVANISPQLGQFIKQRDYTQLAQYVSQHPRIQAIEQSIQASQSGIELAEQGYKAQWGVNASYAYRADEPSGRSRADFFSVGVSLDLPLFTQNAQDQTRAAAISEAEALKTQKRLAIRAMISEVKSLFAGYQGLQQRQSLYTQSLLVQMHEQAETALSAYTNNDGDFSDVVIARIDDLNARIDMLGIKTELLKLRVQLHYYSAGDNSHSSHSFISASTADDIANWQLAPISLGGDL